MNPRAVLSLLIFGCLMLTLTPGASAGPSDTYQSDVVRVTNKKRANNDLHTLKHRACVDKWAERQARWMARHQKLKHQDLRRVLNDCNLKAVGENIAKGYPDGVATVKAWMRSPGHKANILKPRYRYIGVGTKRDKKGTWWVAQVFGAK